MNVTIHSCCNANFNSIIIIIFFFKLNTACSFIYNSIYANFISRLSTFDLIVDNTIGLSLRLLLKETILHNLYII